ncbi:nuclear transport factor 2 family protein [Sphaerisporangium album]|uniref:Nuclear transport factor 2 family protein n=1 Tax=Sphaerisporangium album TaxID=509200 RepID=A0A367F4U4_9ACTN|nr:nuclear transport factor 2 family protein [Sphaerisporangium album]RCG25376.1 nuclear transport factor 2 family protein [Sphaerisporangium album]
MSAQPDITAMAGYEAITKGDLDQVRDLLADDVVFHVPGQGKPAGEYRGKADVVGYLTRLIDITGSSMRYEPDMFLTAEDRVAVMLRITGERGGKAPDERGVHVFRVVDGKIAERWSFPQDSYVIDEFFS